jgi:hypothetical protein
MSRILQKARQKLTTAQRLRAAAATKEANAEETSGAIVFKDDGE